MGKKKKGIGKGFLILGILFILAAVFLIVYNQIENRKAGEAAQSILEQLDQLEELQMQEGQEEPENPEIEEAAEASTPSTYNINVFLANYEYIGRIIIKKIGVELPVMKDWSYDGLRFAPGRYSGSEETDDLIIAGHNYMNHFGKLKRLEMGDQVIFRNLEGREFFYEVKEIEILEESDVADMVAGEWDLTLFTCTTEGKARVTVRCSRIE